MRLAAAATHFDKQVLTDAYGSAKIVGQFDLFDDTKRDGVISRRRILSVAPAVTMPVRNALKMDGMVWIVGSGNPDYFGKDPLRRKYVLHEADGLASVQSFSQFLANEAGVSAYSALEWVKAAKEIDESSELTNIYGAVFARSEVVPQIGIMTLGGIRYLLREPHQSSAGFLAVYVDEIREPAIESGTFANRAYDPVDDVWTATTSAINFIRLRWQSHFKYLSQRTLRYQAGDDVLICLTSAATPKPNDKITLSDGTWQVLTVQPEGATWSLHVRRVPG
jgi:hypothetical protein